MKMLIIVMVSLILTVSMMIINFLISKKMFFNKEKSSNFECGFDPMSNPRMPFSLSFYLVAIVFLIFDVEIAMIMPFIYQPKFLIFEAFTFNMLIFIILILGLLIECLEGALYWPKSNKN
uniref:NADH-ubiquinone oxidoreductase chain 3 n=1 Tax=Platyscapa corneri TaxID=130029 RepID=A0A8A9Y6U2_9HYME|nr:NADH dehydrogenase subunit 3 [Platyscapa corneri]